MGSDIPRVVHFVWVGGSLPQRYARVIDSWKRFFPNSVRVWTDVDVEMLVSCNMEWWEAYQSFPKPIYRADLARLIILYLHGGIYVDLDAECLRDLNILIDSRKEGLIVGRERNLQGNIASAVIIARPYHPAIKKLIDRIISPENIDKIIRGGYAVDVTGPGVFTSILEHEDDVYIAPKMTFYPMSQPRAKVIKGVMNADLESGYGPIMRGRYKGAYTVHWYDGGW